MGDGQIPFISFQSRGWLLFRFGWVGFGVRFRFVLSEKENLKLESAVILKFDLRIHEARNRNSFSTWNSSCIYFKMNLSFVSNFQNFKKSKENFFGNGLSGVRLPVVVLLVDFVFVCWCSRVPAHYAMSVTANG